MTALVRPLSHLSLLCLLVACGPGAKTVDLTGAWPGQAGDYYDVTNAWTRSATLRGGVEDQGGLIIEVFATFKSPAWRAAYVHFRGNRRMLPPDELAALEEIERIEHGKSYEAVLLVATLDRRANDLHKGKRSTWRVALVNDRGEEVEPIEVRRDRRPETEIRADFPHLGPFHTPYIVRFPRAIDILHPGAEQFSIKVASQRGGVELVWRGDGR